MNLKSVFKERADLLLLVVQSIIGFLFLPYLLSFVEIAVYGEIFLIQSSAVFFQLFYNLGYTNTITSYAADWQLKEVYFDQIFKVLFLFLIKLILFLSSLCLFNAFNLLSENIFQYAVIVVVLSLANVLKDIFEVVQRMRNLYRYALILSLVYVILDTIIKIYYLNNYVFSPEDFLALSTGFKILYFTGLLLYLTISKIGRIKFKKEDVVFFKYGLNWAVANSIGKVSAFIDKPLISNNIGLEALGYYAFASKILAATAQFRSMLKNLWIYDALKQYPKHKDLSINKLLKPGVAVVLIAVVLSPFYIYKSLGELNTQVFTYVCVFALIEILWYFYIYSSLAPVYYKDSSSIPRIQFLSFIVYFLSLVLIPYIAIYAILIGKIAQLITLVVLQKRLESKLKNQYT